MLDETKRLLMEEDICTNALDSDDDRMDFADAEMEEITDRVAQEFRKKQRPLKASEIDKVSHGLVGDLKESFLSNVMDPHEYQVLQEGSQFL